MFDREPAPGLKIIESGKNSFEKSPEHSFIIEVGNGKSNKKMVDKMNFDEYTLNIKTFENEKCLRMK